MVQILTVVLPMIGIRVGNDAVTGWVQVTLLLASSIWIWIRRVQAGGVTPLGGRIGYSRD